MNEFITVAFSLVTGIVAVVGSIFVSRRYQSLGGGEAQLKLNQTYRELNAAFEGQIAVLMADLEARDKAFTKCTAELKAMSAEYRRARVTLGQDIDDLHSELRELRQRALADK